MTQSSNKYLLLFLFCIIFSNIRAQTDVFDYNNLLKFARYLKLTNQLTFAAEEYEKLHFLWPTDSTIRIELLQTYRLNGQCEKLTNTYKKFNQETEFLNNSTFAMEYLRYILSCKIELPSINTFIQKIPPSQKEFYQLSYYWVNHDYKKVVDYCSKNEKNSLIANDNLFLLSIKFKDERYKSGAIAGIMSGIVPGSGKAYCNRWGDALISFLFVGANSYSSYVSFKKKGVSSVNGWIFGGLAFSFYSANIWGAVKAAKKYNIEVKEKYQKNAENIIYSNF